jgi:type III pantothenate kinase
MAGEQRRSLVAVDVGNSRVKLGIFEPPMAEPLPHAARTASLEVNWTEAELAAFLPHGPADYDWSIASVNRPAAARLVDWLKRAGATRVRELKHTDLPLAVEVARPDRVGLDRLANAVAANRIRQPDEPAIVIDMGSALTVDLVSAGGAFVGGAILPGIAMSARALDEFTDALPRVEVNEPPPALGKSTDEAIRSGLYWGAVGAVRTLVWQLAEGRDPQIFLTGGAGPIFAGMLSVDSERMPQFVPHLTLAGIALATLAAEVRKGSQ